MYALLHETPSKDLRNAIRNCVSLKDDGELLVSPETSVTGFYTYILVSIVTYFISSTDELTKIEHLTCLRVLGTFLALKTRKKDDSPKADVPHLLIGVEVSTTV